MSGVIKLQRKKRKAVLEGLLRQFPGIHEVLGATEGQLSRRLGMKVFQSSTFDNFALNGCGVEKNYLFIPFIRRRVKFYLILTSTFQEDIASLPHSHWEIGILRADSFSEIDFLKNDFVLWSYHNFRVSNNETPGDAIVLKGRIVLDKFTLALLNMLAKMPPSSK
jgi:hypothetical protein